MYWGYFWFWRLSWSGPKKSGAEKNHIYHGCWHLVLLDMFLSLYASTTALTYCGQSCATPPLKPFQKLLLPTTKHIVLALMCRNIKGISIGMRFCWPSILCVLQLPELRWVATDKTHNFCIIGRRLQELAYKEVPTIITARSKTLPSKPTISLRMSALQRVTCPRYLTSSICLRLGLLICAKVCRIGCESLKIITTANQLFIRVAFFMNGIWREALTVTRFGLLLMARTIKLLICLGPSISFQKIWSYTA